MSFRYIIIVIIEILKTSLLKGFLGRAADRGGSKAAEDTTVWAAQRDTAK